MLKKAAILAGLLAMAAVVLWMASGGRVFEVRNSRTIDRPASEIWSVMSDAGEWREWWPGVQEARLEETWRQGATLHLVLKGTPEERPARVETVVAERELVWKRPGILGSVTRTSILLEPVPGGTRVSLASSIEGPQAVLAGFTGRDAFEKYHEAVLAALGTRLHPRGGP